MFYKEAGTLDFQTCLNLSKGCSEKFLPGGAAKNFPESDVCFSIINSERLWGKRKACSNG